MNEKDVLAIADNFIKGIKGKKIIRVGSESNITDDYAILKLKVIFKGGSDEKKSYNRN